MDFKKMIKIEKDYSIQNQIFSNEGLVLHRKIHPNLFVQPIFEGKGETTPQIRGFFTVIFSGNSCSSKGYHREARKSLIRPNIA